MIIDLSDASIEMKANEVRDRIGMDYVYALDLDNVIRHLRKLISRFQFVKDTAGELGDSEAFMDCETHRLHLSQSVIDGLDCPHSRARFTVAHELGHYFLGHSGNTKRNPDKSIYLTPAQRVQEQQADLFASYFLVPTALARSSNSAEEIQQRFQVSLSVAKIAFERVQRVIRIEKGELRRPPAIVVDFLKEAERHGYKVKSKIDI